MAGAAQPARGAVAIVCAVPAERRALRRLAGRDVTLWTSGMGPGLARVRAGEALATGPQALVSAGFCGALAPDLRVGDVLVAERVVDSRTGASRDCDARLIARAPGRRGVLVSSPRVAATPSARGALDGDAVDMESAALAEASARAGVPFVAVRAVTDEAGSHLPELHVLVDPGGRLRPWRAARHLARRPGDLAGLVRLARAGRRAGRALAAAIAPLAPEGRAG